MPQILANGIRVHYQQAGRGPDVILIHGATGDLSTWYFAVMEPLARAFRVTAYDLRGHGYSEVTASGYTSANLSTDLRGLMDSLEIERAHLVGQSFGSAIALHTASLYPERVASLALVDPSPPALWPLVDLKTWPLLETAKATLAQFGVSIPLEECWYDPEFFVRHTLRVPVPWGLRSGVARTRRTRRLLETTTALKEVQVDSGLTADRIAEVAQPTLVLFGDTSPFLPTAQFFRERMPCCQVAIVKDACHFFALMRHDDLVVALLEFLRTREPATGGDPHCP